ncbi:MAG: class I SAM-dependent methyltransferase [Methylobacter sp.]|nr:class I SAM-dependent methyltransferase [Methylobacter sp.]
MKSSIYSCTCCGAQTAELLLYQKNGISIYKCQNCGTGRADDSGFDAKSYYDESYFNGDRIDGYSNYINSKEVLLEHFRGDMASLGKYGAASGKVLEIGCAYGYFLEIAQEQFSEIYGLEICEEAVINCNQRGLTTVKQGMVSSDSLTDFPSVNTVVMLDVIEHVQNPREALQLAAGKLLPGGHLMLTTGDFSSLAARITGANWRLMTPPQHLWYFTPTALRMLADSLGLDVIAVEHPFKKVPLGLVAFQFCRFAGIKPKIPDWMHRQGIMINMLDAMRLVMRKRL